MRKFLNNKLWRDLAVEKIREQGSIIHVKKLDDVEYDHELRMKLLEEAEEVKLAASKDELIQELADVYE